MEVKLEIEAAKYYSMHRMKLAQERNSMLYNDRKIKY